MLLFKLLTRFGLGDAMLLLEYMKTLSALYQDPDDLSDAPQFTFEKYVFEEPLPEKVDKMCSLMQHLPQGSALAGSSTWNILPTKCITLQMTEETVRNIFGPRLSSEGNQQPQLSIQDILTAWVVTLFNKCTDAPTGRLTNAVSVRFFVSIATHKLMTHPVQAFCGANHFIQRRRKCYLYRMLINKDNGIRHEKLNKFYEVPTLLQPSTPLNDLSVTATHIRQSLKEARSLEHVQDWMSVASELMLNAASIRAPFLWENKPGTLSVNSQAK